MKVSRSHLGGDHSAPCSGEESIRSLENLCLGSSGSHCPVFPFWDISSVPAHCPSRRAKLPALIYTESSLLKSGGGGGVQFKHCNISPTLEVLGCLTRAKAAVFWDDSYTLCGPKLPFKGELRGKF